MPTNQATREFVNFSTAFPSAQQIDYAFDHPSSVLQRDAKGTKCLILPEHLSEKERDIFQDFITLLKIPDQQNFAISTFDATDKLSYFSYPQLGLHNDQPVLMIGADFKKTTYNKEQSASYIPLVCDDGKYSLNGVSVKLTCIRTELATIPYLSIKSKKYSYFVSLRTEKGIPFDNIEHAWDNGEISLYLEPLSKNICKFTKMFKMALDQNVFPTNTGILLTLIKGKLNPPNLEANIKNESSQWFIESYPEQYADLPVIDIAGNLTTLSNVGLIYFGHNTQPCIKLKSLGVNADPKMRYWLHVSGAHSTGITDYYPSHIGTIDASRLNGRIQGIFKSQIQKVLAIGQSEPEQIVKAIEAMASGSDCVPADQTVDVDTINADEYPEHETDGDGIPF